MLVYKHMKTIKIVSGFITILAILAAPMSSAFASYSYSPAVLGDPQTIACRGLAMTGMGCATSGIAVGDYQPKPIRLNFDPFQPYENPAASGTSASTSKAELKAAVDNAKAPKDL